MQDRISRYPGRVRLTPVAGQENVYDMILADEPTQEGTKINKATLLTDVVAASFGLPNTAVPNDVLSKIKTLMDTSSGVINQKIGIITGTYIGDDNGYNTSKPRTISLGVYPLTVIVARSGALFGEHDGLVYGGIALRDVPLIPNKVNIPVLAITQTGFTVDDIRGEDGVSTYYGGYLNSLNITYRYIVFY